MTPPTPSEVLAAQIERLALEHVCPNTMKATTVYEHSMVNLLKSFGTRVSLLRTGQPEGMIAACEAAFEHVSELRDAWQRGCLSEHDGYGGTRSNRNVDVYVKLRDALAAASSGGKDG